MQSLVVDAPAALWSDEAISFKAELASKADLAMAVCKQPEVPQQSRLLQRDADNWSRGKMLMSFHRRVYSV